MKMLRLGSVAVPERGGGSRLSAADVAGAETDASQCVIPEPCYASGTS